MPLKWFFSETRRRNPLLWRVILLQATYVAISIIAFFIDTRTVRGINPWLKPIKFDSSILVYIWTMIWVISALPKDFARSVSKQIAIAIITVTGLVVLQGIRASKSRFDPSDPVDTLIFFMLGISIAYNTLQLFRISYKLSQPLFPHISPAYLRGLQLSLYSIIIGSLIGHFIYFTSIFTRRSASALTKVSNLSPLHTKTWIENLKIAHAIGLHFFQVFIVLGAILAFTRIRLPGSSSLKILNILLVLFIFASSFPISQALQQLHFTISF